MDLVGVFSEKGQGSPQRLDRIFAGAAIFCSPVLCILISEQHPSALLARITLEKEHLPTIREP